MDEAVTRELLQELRRDIAAAELRLAELRRLEAYLLAKLSPDDKQPPSAVPAVPPPEMMGSNYLRGMTQADAAEIVLKEAGGGPMDTRSIVRAMVARGYQDRPQRKALISSVFAVMSKLPERFQKVGRGLWVLASKKEEMMSQQGGTGRR
jgi:HB1, ASXL, restriction endonuclease HTH domain